MRQACRPFRVDGGPAVKLPQPTLQGRVLAQRAASGGKHHSANCPLASGSVAVLIAFFQRVLRPGHVPPSAIADQVLKGDGQGLRQLRRQHAG